MWNQPEIKINLTLIRHGKTPSNKEHRYLGVTEEALSEDGRKQLEILAEKDILRKPWLLFISPMLRCQESAGILFPGKKAYPIEEWREMNFGAYEGKNYEDLKNNAYYQKWIDSNGTLPFPEGESQQEYIKRCHRGLLTATKIIEEKIVREVADTAKTSSANEITELRKPEKQIAENQMTESQPRNITAVVHGGTIMALLHILAGGNYFDYQVKNGGGYCCKLRLCGEEWKLDSLEEITI
ncbi:MULTISPECIES: histidine phosphatase family protein [unclassified Roseburia]|uniref:histidine phosphatase family protein n=1 Tax=unclassified Roseburia TaxID=2637578 RepID=UPI000E551C8B|nr:MULTISPECIES: histidine phosphatase family protein [unclassified Roseburia]RHQ43332.1 histidine phosphatase family protein [Roseburia sp. AF25-25LB]RHQ43528.1 histidine phosphatase family protein [Roseburia sp. AF25-18LB]RHQ50076.1 histidine phosphatase family protein [Roseburia sp. AF25-13LB]RHQ50605.1 histidine phosphatase family protein [Roseburia sp. AF25-15LB]